MEQWIRWQQEKTTAVLFCNEASLKITVEAMIKGKVAIVTGHEKNSISNDTKNKKEDQKMELTQMYLTEEERVNFLKGMVRMARVDGVVEEGERIFFRNLLVALAISEEDSTKLESALDADMELPEVKSYLSVSFSTKRQAIFFLEEAIQLCYIDGVYHEKERAEIRLLTKELNISVETLEKVEKWVQEGMAWQAKGELLLSLE